MIGMILPRSQCKSCAPNTHLGEASPCVQTSLLTTSSSKALCATGAKTKREIVELGLAPLIRLKEQEKIRGLRGKLRCTGDLEVMRRDG